MQMSNGMCPKKLLKVDIPMALSASRAQYECQYGLIERPIVKNTEGEEAMFESCSHRFVRTRTRFLIRRWRGQRLDLWLRRQLAT